MVKIIKLVLKHRTLPRLISLKMASMLALFTFFSCNFNNDHEEVLEQEAEFEKSLVTIEDTRLRQRTAEPRTTQEDTRLRQQVAEPRTTQEGARLRQQAAELRANMLVVARQLEVAQEQALEGARLRQQVAELRATLAAAHQREVAQEQALAEARQREGLPRDVPESWQAQVVDSDENNRNDIDKCPICFSDASFLMYGTCCCPECRKKICKKCYWESIGVGQTRCAFCRVRRLDE